MICPSCNQEMILVKKFETKPRGRRKVNYGIKRFFCSLCEINQTQFADGQVEDSITQETVELAKLDLEGYKSEKLI